MEYVTVDLSGRVYFAFFCMAMNTINSKCIYCFILEITDANFLTLEKLYLFEVTLDVILDFIGVYSPIPCVHLLCVIQFGKTK